MLKVTNINKVKNVFAIKTPEWRQWRRSCVFFNYNFEHIDFE